MGLLSSVKLFLKFDNNNLLLNSVDNTVFGVKGDNTNAMFLENGMGYVMQQDQYLLSGGIFFNIRSDFTLGFWFSPTYPGVVVDDSDTIAALKISLLNASSVDPSMRESVGGNMLVLYEETQESGRNKMVIILEDISSGNYIAKTEEYSVGVWHHFLFVYNGEQSVFNVFIDGKQTILEEEGFLPSSIDMEISNFEINRKIVAGDSDVANNQGYIDDIFVLNTSELVAVDSEEFILKIINHSTEYALDVANEFIVDIDSGFFVDKDPTTINITSMTKNTNKFFIGRTDGSILEGSSLMWQTRRDFSNFREEDLLNKNVLGEKIKIENGTLKVENSIIRI